MPLKSRDDEKPGHYQLCKENEKLPTSSKRSHNSLLFMVIRSEKRKLQASFYPSPLCSGILTLLIPQ